jgi:plastocyanin
MKKQLLVLFAIVFVASGCASNPMDTSGENNGDSPDRSQTPTENQTEPSQNNTNATVVTYTDSGFQPQQVTVEQGDTVIWESSSSRPMWVGSDQHPVHTEYDGSSTSEHCENQEPVSTSVFDQCSSGQTFSFTFKKTGEWRYHNHKYSPHTGMVTVE